MFSGGEIAIKLNDNPDHVDTYHAGSVITGNIIVTQTQEFLAKGLTIQLVGQEIVKFHEHTGVGITRKTEYFGSDLVVGKLTMNLLDLT